MGEPSIEGHPSVHGEPWEEGHPSGERRATESGTPIQVRRALPPWVSIFERRAVCPWDTQQSMASLSGRDIQSQSASRTSWYTLCGMARRRFTEHPFSTGEPCTAGRPLQQVVLGHQACHEYSGIPKHTASLPFRDTPDFTARPQSRETRSDEASQSAMDIPSFRASHH